MTSIRDQRDHAAPGRQRGRPRRKLGHRLAFLLSVPGLIGVAGLSAGVAGGTAGADGGLEETSYVVVLKQSPVVAYDGAEPGLEATSIEVGEKVDVTDPAVRRYVGHLEAEQVRIASESGIEVEDLGVRYAYALNGFEASLDPIEAASIAKHPDVMSVVENEMHQLHTETSGEFLGLDRPGNAWDMGILGEDVVVGVIDSGIWPEHPSFADDGSYSELDGFDSIPCEFGDTAYNPDDAAFACNNKLIGARDMRDIYKLLVGPETFNSARDYDGHGTHTASTAAGNAGVSSQIFGIDRGVVSGVAPRARVIAYSVCGELGCVGSDLAAAIDQAVADGVDVINYSIGSSAPGLLGPDDVAFLFAADAGVFVATSAGNSGPGAETLGSPATVPWVTSVGASTHDRTFEVQARMGNGVPLRGAGLTPATPGTHQFVDAEDLGNELCDPDVPFSGDIAGKVVLCLRGVFARVDKSRAVGAAGGAGMVLYNPSNAQALVTDNHFVPSTHVNRTDGDRAKAYIDAKGADARVTLFEGKAKYTRGSVMADFSSRGPNGAANDLIKPDITAPGVNILAGNTPFPTTGAPGELFQSISGTSMSSPHVAGVFALIKQAHPTWTPAMAKSAVMTTARQSVRKENRITQADPFDMGAGHIDLDDHASSNGSLFKPGLVYDAGFFDYLGFFCEAAPFVVSQADCDFLELIGFGVTAEDLNLPSIGISDVAGSATIFRYVTSTADRRRTFHAKMDAPRGYTATVSPDKLTLNPGETAFFEVTFTNVNAPLDEWRFGDMSWKAGPFDVRSPIALKSTALAAPSEVGGEGADGSVDIPVTFGYTGDYSAAAHGTVPATVITGTVGQDADQSFDASDPEGTTAVPLTTSGSALVRISLTTDDLTVPDPAVDLDLYLYDSAGNQVALSGAGSTDELIEVLLPPDDNWTLYVHGWQTGGADVEFNLQVFDVSATPNTGPLSITAAPPSAVVTESGVVTAAWTGVPEGVNVGAVSHSDSDGIIALTIVEVTVPAP